MITSGTILIEEGTAIPDSIRLESESYPSTWMSVKDGRGRFDFERKLNALGWTLFYFGSQLKTMSFGFDRAKMIHAAMKRMIAKVRLQKCNCVEIDEVETHNFLGMPYMCISAHPRHIQKGLLAGKLA